MFEHNPDKLFGYYQSLAPKTITQATSGTSGTYQASSTNRNKLHRLVCAVAILVEQGTGSSVTVTTGGLIPANTPLYFRPTSTIESIGYKTLSGSAFSGTDILTISTVE